MMSLGLGHVVFASQEVADLSTAPRAPRAAKYLAAMGLWRPQTGPCDPGPVPTSSCNACMNCRYCFPEGQLPPGSTASSSFLRYGSDETVLSYDDCSYCGTLIDCWAIAPGYVTFIWDLHYGMPLALLCRQY